MSTEQEQSFDSTSEPVDLVSNPVSLARAVYARRSEYVRPHRMRVKIGTWNVAACPGTDKDLASWFVDGKGVDKNLATLDVEHNPAAQDSQATVSNERSGSHHDDASSDHNEVHLVGGDKIGLYVLGLQEMVDLNMARVTRMTHDPAPMNKWKDALEAAMPRGYELVTADQMSGLLLLVYASPEVAPTISNVSTVQVGTGVFGYMGNKGSVATRILLGETTRLLFVNCHLASGAEAAYLERRVWDYQQILSRTQFDPVRFAGVADDRHEKIGDEDFGFWLGDLNFRLDGLPGADIRRLLTLHTRGEYDVNKSPGKSNCLDEEEVFVVKNGNEDDDGDDDSTIASTVSQAASFDESASSLPDPDDFLPDPSEDPASLQATLDSLLPHDQLRRVIKDNKAFHEGWREGPVTFLPSYKYDVGTVGLFDSSEKQRAPSWCDRILYRTRRDKEEYEAKIQEAEDAKKRDAEMKAQGIEEAANDDAVLFSYDADADADTEGQQPQQQQKKEEESQQQNQGQSSAYEYDEYDEYDENDDGNEDAEVVTKEGFKDRINLDIYTSHQRIMSSDHKPIISIFTLDYDAAVPDLKAKVHAEVARELDRVENEGRPIITVVLDSQDGSGKEQAGRPADQGQPIDFGEIGYLKRHNTTLTIANTGQAPAKFAFVDTPTIEGGAEASSSTSSAPPHWLKTSFRRPDEDGKGEQNGSGNNDGMVDVGPKVTLEPGETINAVLEVYVKDASHVRALNDGRASLEDILILRVEDGRDHFIPVRGTWLPSCFGRSIEELIRVPGEVGGIRAFVQKLQERTQREEAGRKSKRKKDDGSSRGSIPYDLEVHSAAPRELFKLTEAIESLATRALADEAMLEQPVVPAGDDKAGWPLDEKSWAFRNEPERQAQVCALVDALDTDSPLLEALPLDVPASHRLEVVCEVLRLFLGGLTDGIVSASLWAKIEVALPLLGSSLGSGSGSGSGTAASTSAAATEAVEDEKASVLDILAAAPHHNIAFVFLTATLSKIAAELSPISRAEADALSAAASAAAVGGLGRRSLSFRKSVVGNAIGVGAGVGGSKGERAVAEAALGRRRARERRFAEAVSRDVARVVLPAREKEKKALEERRRALVEIFLRKGFE